VKTVINALVDLQEIDNEIHKYVVQKDTLARTLNELKDLVARMEASVEEKQNKLRDVEKWYQEQVDTLKEYSERMNRIKSSLQSVTKTKDYLLRQKELENLRRHKQTKEDEIEKVNETVKDFRDAISRDMEKIADLKRDTEQEGGATWDQVHQLEATVTEISKKRERLLPLVPPDKLRRYEQIKTRRDGVAIVEATNGNCGGCHVQLRPQQFNILLRMETIENCPNCNRFLFVKKETIDQAKKDAIATPDAPVLEA